MNKPTEQDIFYMKLALQSAEHSRDPSTQNGAVLVKNDSGIVTIVTAANNFPQGVREDVFERWNRPLKYSYIEHAERNVIFKAAKLGVKTQDMIMYCPWFACVDCARAIVQTGITKVIGIAKNNYLTNERWSLSCEIGDKILDEGKVMRVYYDFPRFGIKLRRNGEVVEF